LAFLFNQLQIYANAGYKVRVRGLEVSTALMKQCFLVPPIPDCERTPLVIALLGVIEGLAERVQKQAEEIALLKDKIRILKGGKKRPHFKPSKMDEQSEEVQRVEGSEQDQRRAGCLSYEEGWAAQQRPRGRRAPP
jgi:hypothetical protein